MRQLSAVARYYLRRAVYGSNTLRHILIGTKLATAASPGAARKYWDTVLSGPLATYMGGTISIDARNVLVSTLIRHYAPPTPSVLDIGCAGGSLARRVSELARYKGVDISAYAVEQAEKDPAFTSLIAQGKVSFAAADMCQLPLEPAAWDVIVFNEVLYYLGVEEASRQLERYRAALTPAGIFCISMKDDGKAHAIYSRVAREYSWKDGLLWQFKPEAPDYRVRINRERPAFLLSALKPR